MMKGYYTNVPRNPEKRKAFFKKLKQCVKQVKNLGAPLSLNKRTTQVRVEVEKNEYRFGYRVDTPPTDYYYPKIGYKLLSPLKFLQLFDKKITTKELSQQLEVSAKKVETINLKGWICRDKIGAFSRRIFISKIKPPFTGGTFDFSKIPLSEFQVLLGPPTFLEKGEIKKVEVTIKIKVVK